MLFNRMKNYGKWICLKKPIQILLFTIVCPNESLLITIDAIQTQHFTKPNKVTEQPLSHHLEESWNIEQMIGNPIINSHNF